MNTLHNAISPPPRPIARVDDEIASGVQKVIWRQTLEYQWAALRFGEAKVEMPGKEQTYELQICFDDFDPDAAGSGKYANSVFSRPAQSTPYLILYFAGSRIPLEGRDVLWQ